MQDKQTRNARTIVWSHYSGKGYSVFASLGKQIRIGVLSVATLGTITPVFATSETKRPEVEVAQDGEELSEVTISGTMAPLTQLQSARIVTVLSRTEIQQAGAQSVNDLMKLVSNVDVRQRGGFGIQTDISINGGTYEQVTILLNGVNISNPHTGHLASDFPVSIADIERIEVLEGAASRVYGGQSFGGAINIVTRTDRDNTLSMGAQGGSFGTTLSDGRLSLTKRGITSSLSGGGGRSDGGTTNDAWKKGQLFYQGSLRHQSLDLNWQAGFSRKSYGANTFYSGSSIDQWEQNERYIMSVAAETKGKFHFQPQVYWNRTYDNYQWHKGTPNNSHQADVYGTKLGGYFNWWGGKTALNSEIRNENILSSSLGTDMETSNYVKAHGADKEYTKHASRTNVSYNLEHNIILNRWTISAGVQSNLNTGVDGKFRFYPGVDISYRPHSNWKLYLSYNKGFRLPSFTDLYYKSPDINGNNQLKPEENRSLSLGASFRNTHWSANVRGSYNRGRNMIDYVKEDWKDAAHADNFNLENITLSSEVKYRLNEWFDASASYTFIHQDRDGKYNIFTSLYASEYLRHKFTATVHHQIVKRLSATWNVRWQDRMGSYQVYDNMQATDQLRRYHPYATLDVKLQWTDELYSVFVQGTNLTNHRYCDLGNIPQPGAWIMAGARFNLRF